MQLVDPTEVRLEVRRARLHSAVDRVANLVAVQERRAVLDRLLADLDSQIQRSERAAVVALVGATGAGKSSLLNALVGADIAPVGPDRPTTRTPVIFAPIDADVTALTAVSSDMAEANWRVERYRPRPDQSGYVVVDTPDTNSISADPSFARSLADHCDVLVVVFHRQSIVESEPVAFLDEFARRRALVFVLNRTDELAGAAIEALLAQITSLAASRWNAPDAPVLALSAKEARSDPRRSDWQALLQTLNRIAAGTELQRVRRFNALGTIAHLAELFDEVRSQCDPLLSELPAAVEQGVKELTDSLVDDNAATWKLRQADLSRMLYAEVGKRWDGPSGWALRAGGVESAGLGLGALLLRRHPLAAAGSAIGSTIAAGALEARREQAASEGDLLAPSSGDFERWYSSALSPARLIAARLTGDAEAFAIPGRAATYERIAEVLRDVWLRLSQRELPRVADNRWLRWLRWPFDLPVYAFAVWIAYRVADGFVAERYAGVDFLVNAALLGLAYLAIVRMLMRRLLRWRARRVAAAAAAEARLQLTTWRDQTTATTRAEAAAVQAALQSLSHA